MTPRDALDSPSTHSVASTHSQLTDRSHYSDGGGGGPHSGGGGGSHSRGGHHSSHHQAFADVLNGLLSGHAGSGTARSIGSFTSRSGASGNSDDASPSSFNGHGGRELTLSSIWPAPLPTDAVSQYVGGGGAGGAGGGAGGGGVAVSMGGVAENAMNAMRSFLGGGGVDGGAAHCRAAQGRQRRRRRLTTTTTSSHRSSPPAGRRPRRG